MLLLTGQVRERRQKRAILNVDLTSWKKLLLMPQTHFFRLVFLIHPRSEEKVSKKIKASNGVTRSHKFGRLVY